MQAHGHEVIAHVGELLLRQGLKEANSKKAMRIGAFYLGNWLTDVSQAVDSRAYENLRDNLHSIAESIDAGLKGLESSLVSDFFNTSSLVAPIDELKSLVSEQLKAWRAELSVVPGPERLHTPRKVRPDRVWRSFDEFDADEVGPALLEFGDEIGDLVHEGVADALNEGWEQLDELGLYTVEQVDKAADVLSRKLDEVQEAAAKQLAALREQFLAPLRDLRAQVLAQIDALLKGGAQSDLARFLRSAIHFVGYIKFVVAKKEGKVSHDKMDPDVFEYVFEARFREYFPHEHLDRPEVADPGASGPKYASERADGPRNEYAKKPQVKDLYEYLREHIWLLAGYLSYLDGGPSSDPKGKAISWAEGTFNPKLEHFTDENGRKQAVDDKNKQWNLHLAWLGHALHGVEDYFAHSTFVEHALPHLPDTISRFQRGEDAEIVRRRLKRWTSAFEEQGDAWEKLEDDTHVVSGYFDFRDTLISIGHTVDHLLERPSERISQTADRWYETEYMGIFYDALKFIEEPEKSWKDPKNDPKADDYDANTGNKAVKILKDEYEKSKLKGNIDLVEGNHEKLNLLIDLVKRGPLADLPPSVQKSFAQTVLLGGKVYGGAMLGVTLFKALKNIARFIAKPTKMIEELVGKFLTEEMKKKLESYVKHYLFQAIGSQRIGCHSLIAKDNGEEGGKDLFYDAAKRCAVAVHWYVIKTMMRHGTDRKADLARNDANKVYLHNVIDWLELAEFFLSHPLSVTSDKDIVRFELSYLHRHITRGDPLTDKMSSDQLGTLAAEYGVSWQAIADANFKTAGLSDERRKKQVNRRLLRMKTGVPVEDGKGNYAFKPRVLVWIPRVFALEIPRINDARKRWWYTVITAQGSYGHEEIAKTWLEGGLPSPSAPETAHRWRTSTLKRQREFVSETSRRRNDLEIEYRQADQKREK